MKILQLSAIVEESVYKSAKAIIERDEKLARDVIAKDEEIDNIEVEVEEECLKILALHQPVAIDLRFLVAVLKINNDLERIGDLSVNIANAAITLSNRPAIKIDFEFDRMADITKLMLKKSLDSLVNLDVDLAKEVGGHDDIIDDIHRDSYRKVEEGIKTDPRETNTLLHMLAVSRYIERIADHTTNTSISTTSLAVPWGKATKRR